MSRINANIPVAFANAPAPPGSEPTVNLDTDFGYVLGLIQDSANGFVNSSTDVGIANSYAVNLNATIAPSGYVNGMTVAFLIANTNTGASTLNVNGLGTVPILAVTGAPVTTNTLSAGNIVLVVYYAGNFYVVSVPFTVINQDLGTTGSSGATINCSGANQVNVALNYTGNGPFTLTLNSLGIGTNVYWSAQNSSGGTRSFYIAANTAPLSTTINAVIGLGYFVSGTGYSQRINLTTGGTNQQASGNYMVYIANVQVVGTVPVMIGLIAGG